MQSNNFFGRKFQTWAYSVSHGWLILRSPSNEECASNIDIRFHGVEYFESARFLGQVEIAVPSQEDIINVSKKFGRELKKENIFSITADKRVFFIVAAGMIVEENSLDLFDLGLD
jgi:hypothetical protein